MMPAWGIQTGVSPLCALLILLVPLAIAGLALINTGFGRARGAAHAMLSSLAAVAIAALVYCLWGCSWAGFPAGPRHLFMLGGKPWDWIGGAPLLLRAATLQSSTASLTLLLELFTVSLAALIPISTGAGRWRLRSVCISTAIFAGCTYPLFAHWVWGNGWLAQLGGNFGLGRGCLDPGGAGTVQALGGLSALSIAWILGPRRGRYVAGGGLTSIPGHNIVYVLFGCALLVPGWIGMNSAGAMLFAGVTPARIPLIAVNTVLSASISCLVALAVTRVRFGKPDASLCANGWVAGLVASSAVCCFVTPAIALVVGAVAGALVMLSVELLEVHLMVDDPGGAISVHVVAGLWGLLALGIFPRLSGTGGDSGQLLAQVVGVAALVGLMLPISFGLNWLQNRIDPQRVSPGGERMGTDLHELGGGAYPEFALRSEE